MFRNFCKSLNLNFYKEIILIVFVNAAIIAAIPIVYFLSKNFIYILIGIAILFISNILLFVRYSRIKISNFNNINVNLIKCFEIISIALLNKKEIPLNCLNETPDKNFNKIGLKFVNTLKDDNSITPYLEFADVFKSDLIKLAFVNMYEYQQDKTVKNLALLNDSIKNISQQYKFNLLNKKSKESDSVFFISLLAALIPVIVVLILVMQKMGNIING